ncbi:unnamed protein product [Linum tenue]|uniref:Protein kinase domain-containing protein n=1 Tax=Linum tenue TaxID=586396 RepID=A0AAV0QAZ9_9ROSI|nr:unnamed protein product [Linum tenue]
MEWTRGKPLGQGSFGEVYLAIPTDPKKPKMAVKSVPEDKKESLTAEHQILEKFSGVHGIVRCLGGGLSEELNPVDGLRRYDLLLEYASGGSLMELIARYGRGVGAGIPRRHVRVYTLTLLRALSSIHSLGYVHCDIKPSNILVFPREGEAIPEVKVADFGFATVSGSKNFRGSLRYMPPEVLADRTVTGAMDIWALGCTVLEMLTGEMPWDRLDDDRDVFREIRKGCRPEIPGWLSGDAKDFLNKCFAKNYICRSDADSLLRHPFVAQDSEKTTTRMKTVIEEVQQKQRRHGGAAGFLPQRISRQCGPVLLF